jgi:hypothetical protein
LFSTASSDAFNQPGHETRQSSLSASHRGTDQIDTVSLADSDHHASDKERKVKRAKSSKISKDSFKKTRLQEWQPDQGFSVTMSKLGRRGER